MRKCGFHVQQTSTELRRAIEVVQPTLCVSLAHDLDFWLDVKRDFPGMFLIGRLFELRAGFSSDWRQVDPRRWAEECASLGMPYDAWITRNEPDGITNEITRDDAQRYDEWCCVFRERGLELGFEAVGPNVPAGNWHGANVADYLPNLCQQFKYISLHCYSARAMWDQAPALERAPADVPKTDGEERGWWYCGRYRGWHRAICERWPGREGQFYMVISEGGVAYGVIPDERGLPKYGDVGWKTDLTEDQYFESLDWYTRALNEDDYCLGWAIFMVGAADPKWNSFETLPLCKRLVAVPEIPVQPEPEEPEETMVKIYDFGHGPGDTETRDWDWLESVFGKVKIHPISEQCRPEVGDVVYVVDYLDARVGDSTLITNVRDREGEPVEGVTVVFGWPTAEPHGLAEKPCNWTKKGVKGQTNVEGDNGPGMGPGAYYSPAEGERGPHFVWVWDLPAEMVDGLGMLPGGEPVPGVIGPHAHVNVGYRAVIWKGQEPQPSESPVDRLLDIGDEIKTIAHQLGAGAPVQLTLTFSDGSEVRYSLVAMVTSRLGQLWAALMGHRAHR